jgi:2-polyprenyl-3-methyl-5-hydroxy-6-metoxy-1,4-benzoquinol methylase
MFNLEFLHAEREWEIERLARLFPTGCRILELGGGTGYQAQQLAHRGFPVASIDLPSSNYQQHKVFPVIVYDGRTFPFANGSFDVVFSSNVLEHVLDLGVLGWISGSSGKFMYAVEGMGGRMGV